MIVMVGGVLAFAMLVLIIVLLAKRQLAEKYAVLWLVLCLAAVVVIFVPGLLDGLTKLLHVQVPANLVFGGAILLLVGVALHLSWELSRAESEIRRLAEESAITRLELEKLQRQIGGVERDSSAE